ncbi:MAG: nitrate/nitrite transporter NrtS [Trebonia sp.]
MSDDQRPTWRTPGEACRVVAYRRHLSRTLATALVVGTILFVINHLDTVLRGKAATGTWVEAGLTYLVPFCVANIGILIACRRTTR